MLLTAWFAPAVDSYGYRGVTAMHGPMLNDDTKWVQTAAVAATITQPGTNLIVGG